MSNEHAPVRIFLAEDNEADIILFKEALRSQDINFELTICTQGEQCLEQLTRSDCLPAVFVIDLNLPRINGLELIERIRSMPQFDSIPVVVLTSSRTEYDRARSLALGANQFLTKPHHLDDFLNTVGSGIRRLLSDGKGTRAACRCSKRTRFWYANRASRSATKSNKTMRNKNEQTSSIRHVPVGPRPPYFFNVRTYATPSSSASD